MLVLLLFISIIGYIYGGQCSLSKTIIDLTPRTDINLQLKCDGTPSVECDISPKLPFGITMSKNCAFSGRASKHSQNTTYTITVYDPLETLTFSMTVYDAVSYCTYGNDGEFVLYLNMPVLIDPPFCNAPVNLYSISPDVPSGLLFDIVTGKITGTASTEHPEEIFTVRPITDIGNNDITVTFKLRVEKPSSLPSGLNARFTPDGYCGSFVKYEPIWTDFDKGLVPISYEGIIPHVWGYCDSAKCDWEENLNHGHRLNFCAKFTGYLNILVAGQYTIGFEADDSGHLFIDDLSTPKISITYIEGRKEETFNFNVGLHKIGILYQQTNGEYLIKLEWKSTDAGIYNFVRIPKESLRYEPSPIQHLSYNSNYLTLVKGVNRYFTPTFKGSPTWFTAKSLPTGVTISAENGTIFGIPLVENPNYMPYSISATSGGTSTNTITLHIRVVSVSSAYMEQGVQQRIYRSLKFECNVRPDVNDGYHEVAFSSWVNTIHYPIGKVPFPKLPRELNSSIVITYTGFMYFPVAQKARITLKSVDGSVLIMGRHMIDNHGCANSTGIMVKTEEFDVTVGYYDFTLIYSRILQHSEYGMEVYLNDIPFSNQQLFEIPNGAMEYITRYGDYQSKKEIDDNHIMYHQPPTKDGYTDFNVYPQLPVGFGINTENGTISGIPSGEVQSNTRYIVSARARNQPSYLYTVVTIQVHSSGAPGWLAYKYENGTSAFAINGRIGEKIENLFPITIGNSLIFTVVDGYLPIGIIIDRSSGEISGTPQSDDHGTVTIGVSNQMGMKYFQLKLNIDGCSNDGLYVFYEVYNEDTGVSCELKVNDKVADRHTFQRYGEFYGFGNCFDKDPTISFSMSSSASRPPMIYLKTQNNTVLLARLLKPFNDNIQITWSTAKKEPSLTFNETILTFYTHTTEGYYGNIVGGISKATIKPDLPGGLVFLAPGVIMGLARSTFPPTQFQIDYSNQYGSGSVNITIQVIHCKGANIPFEINIRSDRNADTMSVKLYNSSNYVIADYTGFNNYEVSSYTFCRPKGNYNLKLSSIDGSSWSIYSLVTIYFVQGLELFHGRYSKDSTTNEFKVDLDHLVGIHDNWAYSCSDTNPNWNDLSFDDSKYPRSMTDEFPDRETTTCYFRKTFDFTGDIAKSSSINALFRYDAGILVYINNKEIYRNNLPSGSISPSTLATNMMRPITYIKDSFNVADYIQGRNVITVELHKHSNSTKTNPFSAYLDVNELEWSLSHVNSIFAGSAKTSDPARTGYPVSNLFDGDRNTQWIAEVFQNPGTTVTYTFRGYGREYVNTYCIVSGDVSGRDPKSWILYGSNNGIDYTILDKQTEQYFYQAQARYCYHFANKRSYNNIKWEILSHGDILGSIYQTIQVADFLLYASSLSYCKAEGKWRSITAGSKALIPCPRGYRGQVQRQCGSNGEWTVPDPDFKEYCLPIAPSKIMMETSEIVIPRHNTIRQITFACDAIVTYNLTKALPLGLVFDGQQGIIKGNATELNGRTNYQICASNNLGSLCQIFYLSVVRAVCPEENPWPETEQGFIARIKCTDGQPGYMTRYCKPALVPFWLEPENHCNDNDKPSKKSNSGTIAIIVIVSIIIVMGVVFGAYKYFKVRKAGTGSSAHQKSRYEQLLD